MTTATAARHASSDRANLYQEITDKIIAELEQGRAPWAQPWGSSGVKAPLGLPKNAATGRAYSGVNILILWSAVAECGFTGQRWLTFRQALDLGGHVRKGEKGTTVVFADRFIPERERARAEEAGEEPEAIPFLKRFILFNTDQCDGLPAKVLPPAPESAAPSREDLVVPRAEALIRAIGADLRIGGSRAFYVPAEDFIQVPPKSAFFDQINWYRTVFHEHSHWAGAKNRLNRDQSGCFGSPSYGREELVAEISGAYVCAALSIVPTVRHSDYLAAWIDILQEDNRAIVRAASAASKAADYLLAFLPQADDGEITAVASREAA
ncbi:MAG TPA: zincin-like metallopeptidase domain-containing protein [Stellaceae bacterium]|nr:zincin-like metallopeptidase domain-containing protein [Stellaceae bacterium]